MMQHPSTLTVTLSALFSRIRFALTGLTMAALIPLVTACATPSTESATSASASGGSSSSYQGLFLAPCTELAEGLYYADAVQLKPIDGVRVQASYFKAFFSANDCAGKSRLVRLTLPTATWEIIGQTLIGGKMVDQVIVTLPAGPMSVAISNPAKVQETNDQLLISYGTDGNVALQKLARGGVDKELRMVKGNQLFMSDAAPSDSPDGFPSELLDSAPFERH